MKKVKCKACCERKDQSEFDWLRNQQKYHHDCTACTKKIVTREYKYKIG